MLLFLLRMNRRLRFQVFVLAMLIGTGFLPGPTEGLNKTCHVCLNPSQCYFTTESLVQNCGEDSNGTDYCIKVWNEKYGVRRACLPNKDQFKADCAFETILKGGNTRCMNTSEYNDKIQTCFNDKKDQAQRYDLWFKSENYGFHIWDNDQKICYCKGNNCNDDNEADKIEGFDFPSVKPIEKGHCYKCHYCRQSEAENVSCPVPLCRTFRNEKEGRTGKDCGFWNDYDFDISLGIDGSLKQVTDCYKGSEFKDGCGPARLVKKCFRKFEGLKSAGAGELDRDDNTVCVCKGNFCHGKGGSGNLSYDKPTLAVILFFGIVVRTAVV